MERGYDGLHALSVPRAEHSVTVEGLVRQFLLSSTLATRIVKTMQLRFTKFE